MPTPWEIQCFSSEETTVVRPTGKLTTDTAPRLREALLKQVVEQPLGVVIDLSGLTVAHPGMLTVIPAVESRTGLRPGTPLVAVLPALTRRCRAALGAVPVYSTLDGALANMEAPPSRIRERTTLPATLGSASAARRFVTDTCARWPVELDDDTVDAAVLIASELVENTVQHTPVAELRLRLEWTGRWLHVAVSDDDPEPAAVREPRNSQDTGRGLQLVAALSHTWGCAPRLNSGGKVVWATLSPARST